jgi:hypothetical protein
MGMPSASGRHRAAHLGLPLVARPSRDTLRTPRGGFPILSSLFASSQPLQKGSLLIRPGGVDTDAPKR